MGLSSNGGNFHDCFCVWYSSQSPANTGTPIEDTPNFESFGDFKRVMQLFGFPLVSFWASLRFPLICLWGRPVSPLQATGW